MKWTLVAYAKEGNEIVSAAEVGFLSYIRTSLINIYILYLILLICITYFLW